MPTDRDHAPSRDADSAAGESTARVDGEGGSSSVPASGAARSGSSSLSTRERAERQRQEKLDFVRTQVENGSLTIRAMTDAERLRYPPIPASAKRPPRR
jgi:hypothetical protein